MKRLPLILIFTLLISLSMALIVGAEDYESSFNYNVIIVAIVSMVVTTGIFLIAVIVSYKKKLRGSIYPFDKFTTLDLTDQYDKYSHSHTTRYRYRNSDKKQLLAVSSQQGNCVANYDCLRQAMITT